MLDMETTKKCHMTTLLVSSFMVGFSFVIGTVLGNALMETTNYIVSNFMKENDPLLSARICFVITLIAVLLLAICCVGCLMFDERCLKSNAFFERNVSLQKLEEAEVENFSI